MDGLDGFSTGQRDRGHAFHALKRSADLGDCDVPGEYESLKIYLA